MILFKLFSGKDPYKEGKKYLEQKDYIQAIHSFEKVKSNQIEGRNKEEFIQEIKKEAEKFYQKELEESIKQLDYQTALSINKKVENSLNLIFIDEKEIKNRIIQQIKQIQARINQNLKKNEINKVEQDLEVLKKAENLENLSEYITSIEEKITELKEKLEIQNYKKQASRVSYGNLMREPEKYEGMVVTFAGQVFDRIDEQDYYYLYLHSKYDEYYGYYDDVIIIKVEKNIKVIEQDIIRFYGVFKNLHTYTTIRGDEITVPFIEAEIVEFLSKRS